MTSAPRLPRQRPLKDRKAAKSQPIVVGDRVHNWRAGAGTVMAIVPLDGGVMHYRVRFDASIKGNVPGAKYLERLIAGDEGFEPPAVPMIEHRKDVPMADRLAGGAIGCEWRQGWRSRGPQQRENGEDD